MRWVFSIIIFFTLGCSSSSNDYSIVGKWKLLIVESKDSTNKWQQANWMKGGTGELEYFRGNTLTVRFKPHENDKEGEPYWYKATYIVNSDSNFVKHTRVKHSNPDEIGKTVKRYFEIKKDTLVMHAKEFGFRLKWLKD